MKLFINDEPKETTVKLEFINVHDGISVMGMDNKGLHKYLLIFKNTGVIALQPAAKCGDFKTDKDGYIETVKQ